MTDSSSFITQYTIYLTNKSRLRRKRINEIDFNGPHIFTQIYNEDYVAKQPINNDYPME